MFKGIYSSIHSTGAVRSFRKLDFLENYSYAVYVFQFLCYAVWPQVGMAAWRSL